mgnify:FL=1
MAKGMRTMVVLLVALSGVACGASTDPTSSSAGGSGFYGLQDGATSAASDAVATDAAWGGLDASAAADTSSAADDAWGGWGGADASASDAGAASDTSGGDAGEADGGGQSWQQQSDSPPVAQVSLGGGKTLELVSMRVAVRIEGLRARVLVDHIFYNPFKETVEGDFRYTLPPESEVSYYAMFEGQGGGQPSFFGTGDGLGSSDQATVAGTTPTSVVESSDAKVWGNPKVAKIQRHLEAVQAYEAETAQKIDPAIVEAVAPNTFQAKVFPIPGKGYNRVLIAWEQTLSSLPSGEKGQRVYEYIFTVPQGKLESFDFTLLAKKAHVLSGKVAGNTTGGVADYEPGKVPVNVTAIAVTETTTAAGYLARMTDQADSKGGKLVFHFPPALGGDEVDVLVGSDPVLNKDYATLRLRPQIPGLAAGATATSAHAVFLLDTSRSSHPTRFNIALQLMDKILAGSPGIKAFNVIPFDSGASWLNQTWVTNDAKGRKAAAAAFDGLLLEGASDVGAALRKLAKPSWAVPQGTNVDVFVLTDGAVTWGERSVGALLARFEADSPWKARFFAYRLGLGAENLALFSRLTADGGAIFDCLTPSALPACSQAHQAAGMRLTSATVIPDGGSDGATGGAITDLLIGGRLATLYPGASLTLAGPVASAGKAKIVLEGVLPSGETLIHTIPVTLAPSGQLAPRAWAQIAISQLLDSGDKKLEGLAMALSQHYLVANRVASFLVLQDKQTWTKYDLKDETAKFSGQPLAKIIALGLKLGEGAFSTWSRTVDVLATVGAKLNQSLLNQSFISDVLGAVGKSGMELPYATLSWAGVPAKSVPVSYLDALIDTNLDLVLPFTTEAERRRSQLSDLPGAIRALSTSVERNPGSDELSRLAAYRLAAWGQLESAGELLFAVLMRRPFEPQSWRDLANTISATRPGLAMVLYEAALAGQWDAKWKTLKTVITEEYALFAHSFLAQHPTHAIAPVLKQRVQTLSLKNLSGDLRVTATWNTNATDIDLWITAPNGEKCWYKHKQLSTGGALLDDLTQGYGPERFQVTKAMPGDWKIEVHYFANNGNKLAAETWVDVTIVQDLGNTAPSISHYSVVLKKKNDLALVETVTFK